MVELAYIPRPDRPHWETRSLAGLESQYRADLGPALAAAYGSYRWVYDALRARPDASLFRGRHPVVGGWLGATRVVVKRMYHGGLWGVFARDGFLTCGRVRAHVPLAEFLEDAGIDTAPVVFASWRRIRGLVRCEIGFEMIEGVDADRYFFEKAPPPQGWEQRAGELGALMARLHEIGFVHGDPNLMNFFFRPDGRICVLDLDKSRIVGRPLVERERAPNLDRLERSIRKQGRGHLPGLVDAIIGKIRATYRSAAGALSVALVPDLIAWGVAAHEALLLA